MSDDRDGGLFVAGGICGIASILSYVSATMIPLPRVATFPLAILWPLLSIVYCFALYRLIAREKQGTFNQLGFVFAVLGFTIVAAMLSVQLSIEIGVREFQATFGPSAQDLLPIIRKVTRLVDMGLDVAWDMFIGVALMLSGLAMIGHKQLGIQWAAPSFALGVVLMILNASTFPWPPAERGLFDIGPVVGLFIIAVSVRMIIVGRAERMKDE